MEHNKAALKQKAIGKQTRGHPFEHYNHDVTRYVSNLVSTRQQCLAHIACTVLIQSRMCNVVIKHQQVQQPHGAARRGRNEYHRRDISTGNKQASVAARKAEADILIVFGTRTVQGRTRRLILPIWKSHLSWPIE